MDKASIIKDAIDYIQELHEQERRIQAEILELESGKLKKDPGFDVFEQELPVLLRSKKKKIDDRFCDFGGSKNFSRIELLEVSPSSLSLIMAYIKMVGWFFTLLSTLAAKGCLHGREDIISELDM